MTARGRLSFGWVGNACLLFMLFFFYTTISHAQSRCGFGISCENRSNLLPHEAFPQFVDGAPCNDFMSASGVPAPSGPAVYRFLSMSLPGGPIPPPSWYCCRTDTGACYPATGNSCGNGKRESDEQCDEGEKNGDTGSPTEKWCSLECTFPSCSDGKDNDEDGDTDDLDTSCYKENEIENVYQPGWDFDEHCPPDMNPDEQGNCFPPCFPLDISSKNDANADRINVVFTTDDRANLFEEISSVDELLLQSPFMEYKDRIQFWYDTKPQPPSTAQNTFDICGAGYRITHDSCKGLPHTILVRTSSDRSCTAHVTFGHVMFRSIGDDPRVFVHEMGHAVGSLADEYFFKMSKLELITKPNCANTEKDAMEWWGETQEIYEGCSYNETNWRPHENSIMKNSMSNEGFGYWNIAHLRKLLQAHDGKSSNASKLSAFPWISGSFFALLSEQDQVVADAKENALRIELTRKNDGTYVIAKTEPTTVQFDVKPSWENGYAVKLNIGDSVFTQTFNPMAISISEDFRDDGTIELVEYDEQPKKQVTVYIGVDNIQLKENRTALLPDGSSVPYNIHTAACDSWDENKENDCPPPMMRGQVLETSFGAHTESREQRALKPLLWSILIALLIFCVTWPIVRYDQRKRALRNSDDQSN